MSEKISLDSSEYNNKIMLQIEIAITFLFLDSLSLNFTVSG